MPGDDSQRPSAFLPDVGVASGEHAELVLTGGDRAAFLHNFCTNDIKRLQPGEGCEAFITSAKGRIVDHVAVFAGDDRLTVHTRAGQGERLRAHLDRYLITEDVQLDLRGEQVPHLAVFGRGAADVIRKVAGLDARDWPSCQHATGNMTGHTVVICRWDETAAPGFRLSLDSAASGGTSLESLTQAIMKGRAGEHCSSVAAADYDAFRIDAGSPLYGIDLTEEHLAQEADRTELAISFRKGCYLGQEPIARIDALGHVNRLLRVVQFTGAESPRAGDAVVDAESDAPLGTLTSVGRLDASSAVGLAVLRTSAPVGRAVKTQTSGGSAVPGVVVERAAVAPTSSS